MTPLVLYGAAGAAALAIAAIGTQTVRLASVRSELVLEQRERAEDRARLATAALEQTARFRSTEAAWSAAQQENSRDAEQARQLAQDHAVAAGVAADGLRGRYRALVAACGGPTPHPAAVAAGHPASAPADLLADVFGRIDRAAGELAGYADAARIAGEQCAADYGALRPPA